MNLPFLISPEIAASILTFPDLPGCEMGLARAPGFRIYNDGEPVESRDSQGFQMFLTGVDGWKVDRCATRYSIGSKGLWVTPAALEALRGKKLVRSTREGNIGDESMRASYEAVEIDEADQVVNEDGIAGPDPGNVAPH
jgi:hypothetical protein